MKLEKAIVISCLALLLGGCGGAAVCEKPRLYQESHLGKRIEAPEGLDQLQAGREMTIPEASPRDARPEGAPCLEFPPTLTIDDD